MNTKINVKNFIPGKILPKCGLYKELKMLEIGNELVLYSSKCRKLILPNAINLGSNDFIAIGLYLAEGNTYFNIGRKYNHDGEVAFVNSHPKCINLFCDLLNKFGIPASKLKWKIGLNVNYKHNIAPERLQEYWICKIGLNKDNLRPKPIYYSGNVGRRITTSTSMMGCLHVFHSSIIFRNVFLNFIDKIFDYCIKIKSKERLALILKGFFAGDGCVSYSNKHKREQVEFLCTDSILLNKLRKSLEILGLDSIKETWPEFTKTHTKSLRIYNKHDFFILANYDIPNLIDYKKHNFRNILGVFKI